MSLIPYRAQEGREIVLRHRNAIVVRDQTSQRIELRGLDECPTCRRPLVRSRSPDRAFDNRYEMNRESYVDPDYFRILQAGIHASQGLDEPSSPVRSLLKPASDGARRSRQSTPEAHGRDDHFDHISEPDEPKRSTSSASYTSQSDGNRIRKEAFTPGYFKTFFKEEKVLGRGGKGVVLLVRHEIDECDLGHYACKRVPVGDDHDWLEKVLIEVGILNKLTHPNLVSYRHVWLEPEQLTRFGPSVVCAFILQQYCNGGDLHQYVVGGAPREATKEELKARVRRRSKGQLETPLSSMSGKPQLPFEEIYSLFKDITSGVAYLHSANYIHRDLKPSNCLLHWEGGKLRCLISDFGEVQQENVARKSTGSTGTISYCAPEVLHMDADGRYGNFTTKSDIFSLGMILYFMCFGKLPYRSANALQEELEDLDDLRAEISEWRGFIDERRERSDLPSRLYQLLKKLLAFNPADRPSANDVLSAIKLGSYADGMARNERPPNPALNLHGNRVQNLDSPAPPSTPVSDPRKPPSRSRETVQPSVEGGLESSAPLTNGESTVLGAGEALRNRTKSLSPRRAQTITAIDDEEYPMATSPSVDKYGRTEDHERRGLASPPLLMAPPTSRASQLRHSMSIAVAKGVYSMGQVGGVANQLIRLGLFLAKVTSLLQPCWPYLASLQVGLPLLMLAAFDLLISSSGSSTLARRNYRGEIEFGPSHTRSVVMSLVLLVVHVIIVWTARRRDSLCLAITHDHWSDWDELHD